jgi:Fur family peroxide stress response transcriptional regulator
MSEANKKSSHLNARLATGGAFVHPAAGTRLRACYSGTDHPTAEQVFARQESAGISMATVYNCLDALVHCGLAKQVNMDRGASRFCPNMHEHCGFYCDLWRGMTSIVRRTEIAMPRGFKATHSELHPRVCPDCAREK